MSEIDHKNAERHFCNLKYTYQKYLTSPDLKDPADKIKYKKLVKEFFSSLKTDHHVRAVGRMYD